MENSALVLKNTPLQQVKCINRRCRSNNTGLTEAHKIVCDYYDVEYIRNKMVCVSCLSTCLNHYRCLKDKFKAGECIMDTSCSIYKLHKKEEDGEKEKEDSNVMNFKHVNKHAAAFNNLFDIVFKQIEHLLNRQFLLGKEYLNNKINAIDAEFTKLDEFINNIENDISKIRNDFRAIEKNLQKKPSHRPPKKGKQVYPTLDVGKMMYATPSTILHPWYKCKIINISGNTLYLNFGSYKKTLTKKHVAFSSVSQVEFMVGSRIISKFKDLNSNVPEQYYAGIIAEAPKLLNKFRYLIFFDNGLSQYQYHSNIRLITRKLKYVWNNVHPKCRKYIEYYLKSYPDRIMNRFTKDTHVQVLYKNEWHSAKVIDVDASLVKIYFETQNQYELLYRGSPRFKINIEKHGHLGNYICITKSPQDLIISQSNKSFMDCTNINEEPSVKKLKNVARKSTANKIVAITTNQHKHTTTNLATTSTAPAEMNDNIHLLTLSYNKDRKSVLKCNRPCIDMTSVKPSRNIARKSTTNKIVAITTNQHKHTTTNLATTSTALVEMNDNIHLLTLSNNKDKNSVQKCKRSCIDMTLVKQSRNVARKSTTNKIVAITTNQHKHTTTNLATTSTALVEMNDNIHLLTLSYNKDRNSVHKCNRSCIDMIAYDYNKTKTLNSLAVPMSFGYSRHIMQCIKSNTNTVIYKTPCGRSIDNISEMFNYLISTESKMTIDQFSFESFLDPKSEFKIIDPMILIKDISEGREFKPISCVNSVNNMMPQPMNYLISRQPMSDVGLNVDSNFLFGCDCTDNCADKLKCACWQITRDAQKVLPKLYNHENIGYNYRRLSEGVITGIYECNKLCKCSSSCSNRVVQQPITQKLQLFMTVKKGWGVRCLNDIPKGSFICCYIGNLLTETETLKDGKVYRDQYLADMDLIDTVEKMKKDYESDVYMSDQEISETKNLSDSSDEEFVVTTNNSGSRKNTITDMASRLRKRRKAHNNDNSKKHSMRSFYGKGEDMMYIIDAWTSGNIGRYLNHSCSPNMFVQNVFVDTHDLRFPWVTFFALQNIRAGSELTWDYRYVIDSVPGKVMQCHCESSNCRGRLI